MLMDLPRKILARVRYSGGASQALPRPFEPLWGHAWIVRRLGSRDKGDSERRDFHSSLLLREDGEPLFGAHAAHQAIAIGGAELQPLGRLSHLFRLR